MNKYQSDLTAVTGWSQFLKDCAIEYAVPLETIYKITLDILVMQKQMGVAK